VRRVAAFGRVGMSGCRGVGVSGCRGVGVSGCRGVGVSACRRCGGVSALWRRGGRRGEGLRTFDIVWLVDRALDKPWLGF
jgi:hypothetical protein